MSVDALIQTLLIEQDVDDFLSTFDTNWVRYNRDIYLYYGKKAAGCMDYLLTYADRGFSGNPYEAGADRTYSMDALPQEFPTLGTGDYRTPACIIRNADGTYACDFRYEGHRIYDGMYALKGLPVQTSKAEYEAFTWHFCLADPKN